jgi:hypothetical protein
MALAPHFPLKKIAPNVSPLTKPLENRRAMFAPTHSDFV